MQPHGILAGGPHAGRLKVMQKHAARNWYCGFRLELNGLITQVFKRFFSQVVVHVGSIRATNTGFLVFLNGTF